MVSQIEKIVKQIEGQLARQKDSSIDRKIVSQIEKKVKQIEEQLARLKDSQLDYRKIARWNDMVS